MKFLFSLLFFLCLFACGMPNAPEPGTYYGYLPCADCPGVSYALDLKADGTYQIQIFYSDRSDEPMKKSGSYIVAGDQLTLSGGEMNDLSIEDGRLVVLDSSGERISGDLADRYVLVRERPEGWRMEQEKIQPTGETALFRANGNEPFWSVTFTRDRMTFDGLDQETFSVPLPDPIMPADREAYAYRSQTEAGDLFVTLLPGNCDDTMANKSYPFTARVSLRRGDEKDPTDFEGCGEFIAREPLAGEWRVVSLNGQDLSASSTSPTMNFDLAGSKLTGSTGCNRFNGDFQLDDEARTLVPGPLAVTRKLCPGENPEVEFLKLMNADKLSYRLVPGRVYLRAGGNRMELVR